MKKTIIFTVFLASLLLANGCSQSIESVEVSPEEISFKNITAIEFVSMEESKDFFLMDVHIPEQNHIEGTDAVISYLDIAENLDELPEDKDAPIVVYCRSGSMSLTASQDLIDLGYTDVTNLVGGINAYNAL